MFKISPYSDPFENQWDVFVLNESVNGTIYHTRQFLKYHRDRFCDSSILVFSGDKLVCVVPSCRDGNLFFSHKGSTYGGPVFHKDIYNSKHLPVLMDQILCFYDHKIQFRISNSIYHEEPDNLLIYLLSRHLEMKIELSWYITTNEDFFNNTKNKRTKQYAQKLLKDPTFVCSETNNTKDYMDFYQILEKNLKEKYDTAPTHTLEEFLWLKENLSNYQVLFVAKKDGVLYGGVFVIKATSRCWYTFYISRNIDIPTNPSIALLMYNIQKKAKENGVSFVDFGISTEERGTILNKGLSEYKEFSLGGKPSYRFLFF